MAKQPATMETNPANMEVICWAADRLTANPVALMITWQRPMKLVSGCPPDCCCSIALTIIVLF